MKLVRVLMLGLISLMAAGAARAARFQDCPFAGGAIPDYAAGQKPEWDNWDTRTFRITQDGEDKDISPEGAVCTQSYDEAQGKTEGSALEIMENYKEAWEQLGAEIARDQNDYVVAHLIKDGKEYLAQRKRNPRRRLHDPRNCGGTLQTNSHRAQPQRLPAARPHAGKCRRCTGQEEL